MDARQQLIINNEIELNKLRAVLGIKPIMSISNCNGIRMKQTFNLRDLNKELINNKK